MKKDLARKPESFTANLPPVPPQRYLIPWGKGNNQTFEASEFTLIPRDLKQLLWLSSQSRGLGGQLINGILAKVDLLQVHCVSGLIL